MYYYVTFDWTPLPVGVDRPNRLLRTLRPVLPSSDRNDPKSGRRRALIIDQTSWCLFSAVSKPMFASGISECFFVAFFKFYKVFTLFPVMIPTFTPFLFALPTFTQFVRRDFLGVFFIWIIRILTFTPFNSGLHLLHRSRLTICRLCIIFAYFCTMFA